MDTIAHGLTGALIGYAGFRQRGGRAALWTAIAASEFPDVDIVLSFISGDTYLRWHRGPTHSLLLLPIWSLVVAWVFWEFTGRKNFRMVFGAAAVAMLSHLFMDWITSYGTMLFSPFSDTRYALSWVFIVDVYVWALLLVGVLWAGWTKSAVVARTFLAILVAYFFGCGASQAWALHHAERTPQTLRIAAFPQPLNPLRWTIVRDDGAAVHWIDGAHDDTFRQFHDDKLLPQAEVTFAVKLFRWFAAFPVVEKVEHGGYTILRYRDLRFRTRMPGGKIREGKFVTARAVFSPSGKLVTAALTSAE